MKNVSASTYYAECCDVTFDLQRLHEKCRVFVSTHIMHSYARKLLHSAVFFLQSISEVLTSSINGVGSRGKMVSTILAQLIEPACGEFAGKRNSE